MYYTHKKVAYETKVKVHIKVTFFSGQNILLLWSESTEIDIKLQNVDKS